MTTMQQGLILFGILAAITQKIYADDIQDSIKEGLSYYEKGNLTEAAASLTYATQLIQQKKSEDMVDLLPKAPPGWTIEDDNASAAPMGMFGGGITAEREYVKGDKQVKISLMSDSPMLQGVMMMFTNPMFAASDGGKLEKIKGQKAIVSFGANNDKGDIKIVVDNRILVSVEGSGVSKEELKSFAEAIDFASLQKS